MFEFSGIIVGLVRGIVSEQGGLLRGKHPSVFDPHDPIRLWIIQVGVIISTASLLSLALRKFHQPKVIAEVLGGIILGPTAFGRIPGFTQHIFPEESLPHLNLVANIGLCLFLFLVGLEIDAGVIKRHARLSAAVALAGMALPFALGAALSIPIYNTFIDQSVEFAHFMLFTGVAFSITAFPVLCRILTELGLLDTTVGIVVLSAGVGNDIVGWTLLALSIALVNAGSGLMALWILLTCIAWTTFLLIPGKTAFLWLAKKTGSIESGPTVFFMTVTIIVLFGSAFFTDVIGVHAIFGAFLVGLIVPREGGLAIALTEKLEDMVAIIFLPLYFTLSGLSTDLGLLNDGITLAFTFAIMTLAFAGKFGGCAFAAHFVAGFNWRESATIGSLMSCKGLVELIVLNVGLSAGILSHRVFSMFVLEALVLTFMTTPLVTKLYPPEYRVRFTKSGASLNGVVMNGIDERNLEAHTRKKREYVRRKEQRSLSKERISIARENHGEEQRTRFTVVLDRIEHLPGAMAVTQLLNPLVYGFDEEIDQDDNASADGSLGEDGLLSGRLQLKPKNNDTGRQSPTPSTISFSAPSIASSISWPSPIINALRLIKLTDRVSAVMKSHETSALLHTDSLLSTYRMFALLQGINVFSDLDVVPEEEMAGSTLEKAGAFGAEMVIVPWVIHSTNALVNTLGTDDWQSQVQSQAQTPRTGVTHNPFDVLFSKSIGKDMASTSALPDMHIPGHKFWSLAPNISVTHSHFIRNVFARSDVDVGLYIDQSGLITNSLHGVDRRTNPMSFASGVGSSKGRGRVHIFLPFFGGPDDRLALEFVVGLCRQNERLRATVVRLRKLKNDAVGSTASGNGTTPGAESGDQTHGDRDEETNMATVMPNVSGFPDTVYNHVDTKIRLQSETADDIIWARYATTQSHIARNYSASSASTTIPELESLSLTPRVTFKDVASAKPLHTALEEVYTLQRPSSSNNPKRKNSRASTAGVGVVVVTGRSRRLAVEGHRTELKELVLASWAGGNGETLESGMVGEVRKTVGEVGSAFVGRGAGVGVWVLQAALEKERY